MWRISGPRVIHIYALRDRVTIVGASCANAINHTSSRALTAAPSSKPNNAAGKSNTATSSATPPPPGRSGGRTYVIGAGVAATIGAVLFAGYTGYSDSCRYWVVEKVPATKGIYSYFGLQTQPPPPQPEIESSGSPTSVMAVADKTVSGMSTDKAAAKDSNKKAEAIHKKQEAKSQEQKSLRDKKMAEMEEKAKEMANMKLMQEMEREKKEKDEKEQLAKELLNKIRLNQEFEARASKEISALCDMADTVVKLNLQTIDICKQHAAKLREALDAHLDEEATAVWPRVHELNEVRIQRLEESHQRQQEVENRIVAFKQFIDDTKKDSNTSDNESLPSYRKQVQQLAFDVKSVYDKLKSQETVSNVMKHYYCMLQKDKAEFVKELKAIVPEVKLGDKGLNVSAEELNALLAHAHRRIVQLRQQRFVQNYNEKERLEDALCEQKKRDMAEASEKVGKELDKQYDDLQLEKEAELMAQTTKFETELRNQLAKQASEHQDRLQHTLGLQQKKLMEQFDLALRERMIHERHVYIDQIMKHLAKVKGLESALEERANLQVVVAEVQDLVSSAMCLVHAVAHDEDCSSSDYQIVPLGDSLKRCAQAGEHDAFVQTVLHGIPRIAAERGICTISSLKKRFDKVYEKCRKDAYSDSGSLLGSYLSHIRYYFHTRSVKYVNTCELEGIENMSTSDLLDQAEYFMSKNCLSEAVQCFVQLTGTPRSLAQDWIEEARLVLELRQAAHVLQAYAQSKGMGTIF